MRTDYVIKSLVNGGFWDNHTLSFKGWLFANHYSDKESLTFKTDLELAIISSPCEVVLYYYKK